MKMNSQDKMSIETKRKLGKFSTKLPKKGAFTIETEPEFPKLHPGPAAAAAASTKQHGVRSSRRSAAPMPIGLVPPSGLRRPTSSDSPSTSATAGSSWPALMRHTRL